MTHSMRQIAEKIDQGALVYSLSRLMALDKKPKSLARLCERVLQSRWQRIKFICLNAYLMDVDIDDWFGNSTRGSKPQVGARANEIGRYVKDHYDLAALCEVWTNAEKGALLRQWPTPPQHSHRITRKIQWNRPREAFRSEKNRTGSSGLLTISQKLQIVGEKFGEYRHETGRAERKADKGVLLTTLDTGLGPSRLQLYNTHLQSGNKIVALKQVIELAKFILETRGHQDVAILAGDFNLSANDTERFNMNEISDVGFSIPNQIHQAIFYEVSDGQVTSVRRENKTAYELLQNILEVIGFRDLWAVRNGSTGYTSGANRPGIMEKVCRPDIQNPNYCDDSAVTSTTDSSRIDYIFVSPAAKNQSFQLEFTRPRRLRLERTDDAPGKHEIAFLSDHIGLETTLLIAPNESSL